MKTADYISALEGKKPKKMRKRKDNVPKNSLAQGTLGRILETEDRTNKSALSIDRDEVVQLPSSDIDFVL